VCSFQENGARALSSQDEFHSVAGHRDVDAALFREFAKSCDGAFLDS
jgi:hypothetical protein